MTKTWDCNVKLFLLVNKLFCNAIQHFRYLCDAQCAIYAGFQHNCFTAICQAPCLAKFHCGLLPPLQAWYNTITGEDFLAHLCICITFCLSAIQTRIKFIARKVSQLAITRHLPVTPMMVYCTGRWAHINVRLHFLHRYRGFNYA